MSENLDGIPPSPDAESREGRARRVDGVAGGVIPAEG
jgi:hypothetical protein